MEIRREPLAEQPKIGEYELDMPSPTHDMFRKMVLDEFAGAEIPIDADIDDWIYPSLRVARSR